MDPQTPPRAIGAMIVLIALAGVPAVAAAGSPAYLEALTFLEIKTHGRFRLVHPSRYAHLNYDYIKGSEPDYTIKKMKFRLIDIEAQKLFDITAPLEAISGEKAKLLIKGKAFYSNSAGHRFSTFNAMLIYYDPEAGEGGLLLTNDAEAPRTQAWKQRSIYLAWDLKADRLTWERVINEDRGTKAEAYDYYCVNIGPDPNGPFHYFYTTRKVASGPERQSARITLLRLNRETRDIDWRYTFETAVSNNPNIHSRLKVFPSPDHSLFVFAEYSEKENEPIDPHAQLHLVDVRGNSHFTLPVAYTPYAAVISGDNSKLVVGSNQNGTLTTYDLVAKKELATIKSLRHIHQMTFSADEKLLYVFPRASSMEVRAWPGLKRKKKITAQSVFETKMRFSPEVSVVNADRNRILLPPTSGSGHSAEVDGVWIVKLD